MYERHTLFIKNLNRLLYTDTAATKGGLVSVYDRGVKILRKRIYCR